MNEVGLVFAYWRKFPFPMVESIFFYTHTLIHTTIHNNHPPTHSVKSNYREASLPHPPPIQNSQAGPDICFETQYQFVSKIFSKQIEDTKI